MGKTDMFKRREVGGAPPPSACMWIKDSLVVDNVATSSAKAGRSSTNSDHFMHGVHIPELQGTLKNNERKMR